MIGRREGTCLALLALLSSAACSKKPPLAPVGLDEPQRDLASKARPAPPPVAGHIVASVGERAIGPFLARRGAGEGAAGLVAWVTVAEGWGRRVLAVPVGPDGAPRGGETVVAHVSVDTTMLRVRPMRGPSPGFVVAWTSLTDRGESLWSVAVGDDGKPRSKPVELARTTDDVVWVDVVPTDVGGVVLWAEETRNGDANLVAAPLDPDGKVRGSPTRVARGIVGWHALALPSSIGLSTVARPSGGDATAPRPAGARSGGALSFQRLDLDGHPTGSPVVISKKPVVGGDVEVVRDGSRLVFAWTDLSTEEPSVAGAALDDKDVVTPPRTIASGRGGASLVHLTSGGAGVALMFEAPAGQRDARRMHIAHIGADLALGRPTLSFDVLGRGPPELTATASGFAVLATAPDCASDDPRCAIAHPIATLLRTDQRLGLVQREQLDFKTDPAVLGWSLTCDGDTCFSLAASESPGAPSRVRSAAVRPRTNTRPVAAKTATPKDGPHVADVTAIGAGERIVDIATARFGDARLVAMLGVVGSARRSPGAAHHDAHASRTSSEMTLSTRVVDESGTPSVPSVIATRALHVGGVAVAATDKPDDGGAIAWVARDSGDPQVHVTRLDKRGRRTKDIQLTTAKGDASDVTITWAGDGWVVAWVDGRDGNGEVYATKVSTDLSRIGRGERITNAPGDASDLVALAHGDVVWLAWADPRESPREGLADVYVSAVAKRDGQRVLDEQRVLPTVAHSRTPRLVATTRGVHVAWIEEAPMGAETPSASGYGAFWAKLDEAGKVVGRPTRIPLAGDGAATSVAIDAELRAVVARSTPDAITLDAVDLSAAAPRAGSLLALDGPPSLDVALVLEDSVVYFNDDGPQPSDRRPRRARIAWTP